MTVFDRENVKAPRNAEMLCGSCFHARTCCLVDANLTKTPPLLLISFLCSCVLQCTAHFRFPRPFSFADFTYLISSADISKDDVHIQEYVREPFSPIINFPYFY